MEGRVLSQGDMLDGTDSECHSLPRGLQCDATLLVLWDGGLECDGEGNRDLPAFAIQIGWHIGHRAGSHARVLAYSLIWAWVRNAFPGPPQ
jgi:hypothetical protein